MRDLIGQKQRITLQKVHKKAKTTELSPTEIKSFKVLFTQKVILGAHFAKKVSFGDWSPKRGPIWEHCVT